MRTGPEILNAYRNVIWETTLDLFEEGIKYADNNPLMETTNKSFNDVVDFADNFPSDETIIKIITLYNKFGVDKISNDGKILDISTIKKELIKDVCSRKS